MWGVQRGKSSEEIDDDGNTVAKKIHVVKKNMKQIWKHDETWINMGFTLFKICMYQLFTSANEMSKMPSALSVYMTCSDGNRDTIQILGTKHDVSCHGPKSNCPRTK